MPAPEHSARLRARAADLDEAESEGQDLLGRDEAPSEGDSSLRKDHPRFDGPPNLQLVACLGSEQRRAPQRVADNPRVKMAGICSQRVRKRVRRATDGDHFQ